MINGFSNGDTYKAIILEQQSMVCTITGGYPSPTLTWTCFFGTVTNVSGAQSEVKKRVTWTATNTGSATCQCVSNQKVSRQQVSSLTVDVLCEY